MANILKNLRKEVLQSFQLTPGMISKFQTLRENRSLSCSEASSAIYLLGIVASFKDAAITREWFRDYWRVFSSRVHTCLVNPEDFTLYGVQMYSLLKGSLLLAETLVPHSVEETFNLTFKKFYCVLNLLSGRDISTGLHCVYKGQCLGLNVSQNMINSYAQAGRKKVAEMTAPEFTMFTFSVAKLCEQDVAFPILEEAFFHLHANNRSFSSRELSQLFSACAFVIDSKRNGSEKLLLSLIRTTDFRSLKIARDISRIVLAVSWLPGPCLDDSVRKLLLQLTSRGLEAPNLDFRNISQFLTSLHRVFGGRERINGGDVEGILKRLLTASKPLLENYKLPLSHLLGFLKGFVSCGYFDEELFERICYYYDLFDGDLPLTDISDLLWVYAKVGVGEAKPILHRMIAQLCSKDYSAIVYTDTGMTAIWSLAVIGFHFPPSLLVKGLAENIEGYQTQELSDALKIGQIMCERTEMIADELYFDKGTRRVSFFQNMVSSALPKTFEWENEGLVDRVSVDVLCRAAKIAVEINGPIHYLYDLSKCRYILEGSSKTKKAMLERLGWVVVEVPFFEIQDMPFRSLQEYMSAKIANARSN